MWLTYSPTEFQGRDGFPSDLSIQGQATASPIRIDFPGQDCDSQTRAPSGPPLVLLSGDKSCALVVASLLVQAEVTGRDG